MHRPISIGEKPIIVVFQAANSTTASDSTLGIRRVQNYGHMGTFVPRYYLMGT